MRVSIAHEIKYLAGLTSASGVPYLAWSGIVGCLTYLSILSLVIRRLNCSVTGCYRPGYRKVAGTEYTVCGHHHPSRRVRITHQMITDAYADAMGVDSSRPQKP